jgi:D-alanyl-D-alanine-carboxypeptidase/D-alanyl-D-alanine-endopeptidase
MKFSTIVLTLAVLVPHHLAAQFPADSTILRIIKERVDGKRSTGIVVGLLDADGKTRIIAYNERGHGEGAFDENSVFEIGSITKAFTGALLADMVSRGEVALADPVSKYLPSNVRMPSRGGKQITLLDLATQTSALPRLPGNMKPADIMNPYADYSVEQMYAFLSTVELTRDIGAQYEYSNLGVGLLGHVLALRAGKPYEQLVTERILAPLGMTSTSITLNEDQKKRLAPGHNIGGLVTRNWDLPTLAGAGALRSTVVDMLKFMRANLDSTSSATAKRIQLANRSHRPINAQGEIGLAWHIRKANGRTLVMHNGGTGGYRTFTGFDQTNKRAVVVLTNSALSSDDIGIHLLDPTVPLTAR